MRRRGARMSPGLASPSTGLHLAPEVKLVHLDYQGHHAGRAALGMDHPLREVGGLSGPDRGLVRPLSDPAGSVDWHEELTEPGFVKSDPAARTEPKNTDMGLTLPEGHRRSMGTDAVPILDPKPVADREVDDLHPRNSRPPLGVDLAPENKSQRLRVVVLALDDVVNLEHLWRA